MCFIIFLSTLWKMGKGDIFRLTAGNESLLQDSSDNGVRIAHFSTSKNLVVKCIMFPHKTFVKTLGSLLMERLTTRLITYWYIGDGIWVYSMYDLSGELTVILVAEVKERLAVSKQAAQRFDVDRFNLRKLSELEVIKQYHIWISNRFAVLENFNDSEDINRAWENKETS